MKGFPVNIADFRCRAVRSRPSLTSLRAAHRPGGFSLVQTHPQQSSSVSLSDAVISSNPRVYDIGIAREARQTHQRPVFRLIPIVRRTNVVRFSNASEPAATQVHSQKQSLKSSGDDSYDLPPAA